MSKTENLTVELLCQSPMLYEGERVITFGAIDQVHQKAEGAARVAFNRHKKRFKLGIHYYEIDAETSRIYGIRGGSNTKRVKVLNKRGYLLLAKVFDDDVAWQVQDMLVECYFILEQQHQQAAQQPDTFQLLASILQQMLEDNRQRDAEVKAIREEMGSLARSIHDLSHPRPVYPDCPPVFVMQFIREAWPCSTSAQRQEVLKVYMQVISKEAEDDGARLRGRPWNTHEKGNLQIPGQYAKYLSRAILKVQQDHTKPGDFGPLFQARANFAAN